MLLPLDLVLPAKSPALAPALAAAKGLPKSGKTNSTAADDASSDGSDSDDDKALPADVSAGSMRFKVVSWVNVVVGVGLVGAAMV